MKKWTKKEVEFLKKNYNNFINSDLAKKLNTTQSSIEHKLKRIGLKKEYPKTHKNKRWTKEDLNFLRNHQNLSKNEFSKKLNRTYGSIKHKVKELDLSPKKEWSLWNKEELSYLKKNYLRLSFTEIGNKLNKSRRAVAHIAGVLNLNKSSKISKSQILKAYFKRHTIHLKDKPLSEKTKKKLSKAMKNYWRREDPKILKEIRRKAIETRIRRGSQSGKNHPWYGKKKPWFAEIGRNQWKDIEHRKKIVDALSKSTSEGSKNQNWMHQQLSNLFGENKVKLNDWDALDYKYEIDISIPSKEIAIEWDGMYWHYKHKKKNLGRDKKKNEAIIGKGWKFIRVTDKGMNKHDLYRIYENLLFLIDNIHSPEFKFTAGVYID